MVDELASVSSLHSAYRQEFVAALDRQVRQLSAARAFPNHQPSRLSLWWWTDEDGRVLLKLRFRGAAVTVNGVADTALLTSLEEVAKVLAGVRTAALAGRLDRQLAEAASRR